MDSDLNVLYTYPNESLLAVDSTWDQYDQITTCTVFLKEGEAVNVCFIFVSDPGRFKDPSRSCSGCYTDQFRGRRSLLLAL